MIIPSYDYNKRTIQSGDYRYTVQFLSSLVSDDLISRIFAGIELIQNPQQLEGNFFIGSVKQIQDLKTIDLAILSGNAIIEVDGIYFELDIRRYPGRSINEPETEKSVRGAKDGFVEALLTNTGLIRRRIRHPALMFEKMTIGTLAPMDICLCYIDTICDQNIKKEIQKRLSKISTKDLVMSDRALEELLLHQVYNPFPLVRYSERPDIVSTHLTKGYFAIITDTSASIMLLPTSLPEILEHVEEHRQVPMIGTLIRLVRLLAVFLSVYLLPFWILTLLNGNHQIFLFATIPDLEFNRFMMQVMIVEIAIELLRIATIHTPTGLSSAMGMVAAILLGELAIDLGLFIPEILLYSAISNVGGFATPNYELSLANKYIKLGMLLSIWLFQEIGFVLFNFILLLYLMNLNVFHQSYLYPFVPFDAKDLLYFFIRKPKSSKAK